MSRPVLVVFRRLTEIYEYERPTVVTRLRGLYLSNQLTDLHAAIFNRVAPSLLPSNGQLLSMHVGDP